jgi:hypothetical protein
VEFGKRRERHHGIDLLITFGNDGIKAAIRDLHVQGSILPVLSFRQ